jgi:hypothetical protein
MSPATEHAERVGLDGFAAAGRSRQGVTARALILGSLLIPANCLWVVRMERVSYGPYPSTVSLFANVVFTLFLLVGLNRLLLRFRPGAAFTQAELLTLYTMQAISTGLAGLDGVSALCQIIPHGAWAANPQNHWASWLGSFPDWLVIRDRSAVEGHYLGHSSFLQPRVLRAWATPIFAWTLLVVLLLFVCQCMNVLIRPQWADHERLSFPLISLPLAMTDPDHESGLWRSRLMWTGFALAAGLNFWNGLAVLYPTLPAVSLASIDLKTYLTVKPWSAIDWLPVTFYPFVIGLGFLLPLDLLFSCWFFFLVWNLQTVAASASGYGGQIQGFPFIREQGFGSLMALFAYYAWTGRKHYAGAWRRPGGRMALLGAAVGILALQIFGYAAGVSPWLMTAFLGVYFAAALVVTRIRAEMGAPVHDFHFMDAGTMLPESLGTSAFSHHDLAFLTGTYVLTRAHRSDTMPVGLEGLQMAHLRGFPLRPMFAATLLATVLGCLGTFWAYEHLAYRLGADAHFQAGEGMGVEAFNRLGGWLSGSQNALPNSQAGGAIGFGALCTLALAVLRVRFLGFPFHPIGYAVSSSWAIHLIWFPLLLAWAIKAPILRYGGLNGYRRSVPFFLGLVLGDCVMGSIWGVLGLSLGIRTYNFFGV